MAKGKEQKGEQLGNAPLTRMNFLYQASFLTSNLPTNIKLSCYYGKVLKEISMKMVEKIHPDMKRTMCTACNCSLTATNKLINVKVKPHNNKKKKQKQPISKINCSTNIGNNTKTYNCKAAHNLYTKSRIDKRNKKPNKIVYSCSNCGFSKQYIQQPDYKIWIHRMNDSTNSSGLINC